MPDDPRLRIFPDEFVPNVQASDTYKRWAKSSPRDKARWELFRDVLLQGQTSALPTMSTVFGKALVAAGEEHMSISQLVGQVTNPYPPPDPPPPPPPPAGDAYFITDFSGGYFGYPYSSLFYDGGNGYVSDVATVHPTQTPDGRVQVVPNPSGSGNVARFEIRDSDPYWPVIPTVQKSEARSTEDRTWDQTVVPLGEERWFSVPIYFPYTTGEKFEFPRGGAQPYFDLMELHGSSGSSANHCLQLVWAAWQFNGEYAGYENVWANFFVRGGPVAEGGDENLQVLKLWQMTDASANPYMPNHNRWINLVWGERFATDSTGWIECWVDGVNVVPRTYGPTAWTANMYFKHGLYARYDTSYPVSGGTVIYFGRSTISYTRPF